MSDYTPLLPFTLALRKHVDEEDKTTVAICDTGSNYKTQAVIINESGLYSLILSSNSLRLAPVKEQCGCSDWKNC